MILRDSPPSLLQGVSSFVAAELGLHFPENRHRELTRAMEATAKELGFEEGEALAQQILHRGLSQEEMTVFTDHLTIGETYFLRDQAFFDALEQVILPELLASRGPGSPPVRIWSAGCSTGEEPYSVAMAAHRCQGNNDLADVSILATDVNTRFLERAMKGVYGEWSFRTTPDWVRDRYFLPMGGGKFRINARIREMVTFSRLNLKERAASTRPPHGQKMDIILCRNVLMYFDSETRKEILAWLVQSLAAEGWFFVSPTEIAIIDHSHLSKVRFPGFFCFKNLGAPTEPPSGVAGAREPERRVRRIFQRARQQPRKRTATPTNRTTHQPSRPATKPSRARPKQARPRQDLLAAAQDFFERGEFQEVIALMEPYEAVTDRGSHTRAEDRGLPALLSRSYANLGQLDEALHWCKVALHADESLARNHLLLADIHQEKGDLGPSRAALRRALYLEPDSIIGRFRMGVLCQREGRPDDSNRWFRGMVELLETLESDEVVADSDGRTAADLKELAESLLTEVEP